MLLLSLLGLMGNTVVAQEVASKDSLHLEHIQEVVVSGVRALKNAPFAVTNIKKAELQEHSKTGRELPLLLAKTPGIMAWGENGLGIGTTYMRIRGVRDARINVTLDGVPLNSPEDQCVFWANMNSYSALLGSVQVQRGVGTSTNGDGAFGGTVALSTAAPFLTPRGEINFSYGSYNTMNYGGSASTGLLWNQLVIDGAWHQTQTNGFVHGTDGRSGSYYGGITWMPNNRLTLRYKNIGNYEKTGQAWNGVIAGDDDLSLMDGTYGAATGIKTYGDLYDKGLGKFNPLYEQMLHSDPSNPYSSFATDANGNYLTQHYQMSDGSFWKHTTDNFKQNHNLLSMAWDINDHWTTSATLHYTYGYGYYEEFRLDNKLPKKFGLNYFKADGKEKKSDVVRQKGLKQHTYGLVWNANYKNEQWNIIGGLALQRFSGNHFGYITYIKDKAISDEVLKNGRYTYYDSDATKDDHSAFIKAAYHINPQWTAFGDVQYRHVGYRTDGYNDKFVKQSDGTYGKHYLDIDKHYHFINPKAGISWNKGPHNAYASVAMSHREPERDNFTDNYKYPSPKAERMLDYELGYNFSTNKVRLGANLYYMDYTDQFVQTGELSEIGEPLTTNIRDSYRMGIEMTAVWDICPLLTLEGNAALSQNKLKNFDEVASVNWDDDWRTIHYNKSTIAFSPSLLLNGFLNFHWKSLEATWHTNFVSRQYLDNTENKDRSLPSFTTSNLNLSYTLPCNRWAGLREVVFGTTLTNLFSARYAANGWVYSTICEEYGHPNENRYYQIGYVPAAGFTAMGSVTLRF
ncbi:MAG: TonB-dependent receptor [Bacteroidaceae bacterium]|nr:TonB-dependent receptor [Bacteroidaceae bacterium]